MHFTRFFFVVVIATGEPYGCGKKTEVIDFLKNNEQNELLLDMPPCYGCAGELIQVSLFNPNLSRVPLCTVVPRLLYSPST